MKSPHNTQFERYVLASGLLSQQYLDQARESLCTFSGGAGPTDGHLSGRQLADQLVDLGHLNSWQASQLLEGRTKFSLGPYRIVDSIGRGGMGQVFKAQHSILNTVVAIKVLPREKCTPEAIANFMREIRAQSKLDHPNLVRALDAGEDGNVHYLVTEYVPGSDLRKLIRRGGRMDTQTAAHVISQVAAALEHAHQRGLIHRDVKPGNVLVAPDNTAKLTDLGLAGPLGGDAGDDPRIGKIAGTVDYLSPDHITTPGNPTPAWDIYSLGCTLYYAVTGNVPFPKGTTREKAAAHCTLRPLDPGKINHQLEPEFVEIIADMMAKDPAERIGSAGEVVLRLSGWTGRSSPSAGRKIGSTSKPDPATGRADVTRAELEDTQSSVPEVTLAGPGRPADSIQPTQAALSPTGPPQDSYAEPEPPPIGPPYDTRILFSLAVLLALPVALACVISWIWWLAQ